MTDWQERIDRETPPAIRAEHELRYRAVAPLLSAAGTWVDLGCGNGIAPARALGSARPDEIVLVDLEESAVATAAAELNVPDARRITGDLSETGVLREVRDALLAGPVPRVATCFELVEHLPSFVELLQWATALCADGEVTFVLSVPNDALWSIENPFHAARWGDGAFGELLSLVPDARTELRQLALTGSALTVARNPGQRQELVIEIDDDLAPSHFLVAFGPRHAELESGATAVAHDQRAQRRWERQRESDLAFAEAELATLRPLVAERDQWRTYIHELERSLGRPPSGSDAARAAS